MRISVLGSLQIWGREAMLPLYGQRERRILAALLSNVNHPVATSRLIGSGWDDPPPTARRQLQNCIWELRRLLGRAAGTTPLIATTAEGYQINLGPGQLDAQAFRDEVTAAGQHYAARRLLEAMTRFREALGMWRGPALDGIVGNLAETWAAKLNEERAAVAEQCLDIELSLGRHKAVLAELTELVGVYPLRERLVWQLMVALYRSGRQADALHEYQRMVARLGDLGIGPTPLLPRLQVAILRNDPELRIETG